MSSKDKRWGYAPARFEPADEAGLKWKSRYDMNTEEYQNLFAQNSSPIYTQVFDLGVAQPSVNPLEVQVLGRAFSIKGMTGSTEYNFTANTGIETVNTTTLMGVWINKKGTNADAMLMKNGGGFRGDFKSLFLFWPTQDGLKIRLTVYKFDDMPWMPGDAST